MGDALIDVWFSLLRLSYSLAHTYKFLKELFFSCTVDFNRARWSDFVEIFDPQGI